MDWIQFAKVIALGLVMVALIKGFVKACASFITKLQQDPEELVTEDPTKIPTEFEIAAQGALEAQEHAMDDRLTPGPLVQEGARSYGTWKNERP